MNVIEDGNYTLRCCNKIDTYGYIYKDKFNPYDPWMNQVGENNNNGFTDDFRLFAYLLSNTTYILVVTTYDDHHVGPFSIITSDPNNVFLKYTSEYSYHVLENE